MVSPEQAAEAIGNQPAGDYTLDLAAHLERYKDVAPLARLLRSTPLRLIREDYARAGAEAVAAQRRYKGTMSRANAAVLGVAALSALMMAAQIVSPKLEIPGLLLALGILSALVGAGATMWLFRARQGDMLDTWMHDRAEAETYRISYFAAVTKPTDAHAPDIDYNLLRLEYFRRYQLDVQKNYYEFRGRAHGRSADKTLNLASGAVIVSTFASLLTAGLGAVNGLATALGAVGVFGAALSSYAGSREALSQDRRNAERYGRTYKALRALEAKLDDVRKSVAAGNEQALAEFANAVNEQISLEHRQWLEETEATRSALAKLEEALARTREPAPPPPAARAPQPPTHSARDPAREASGTNEAHG